MKHFTWEEHHAIHDALEAASRAELRIAASGVCDANEEAVAFRHSRGTLWALTPGRGFVTASYPGVPETGAIASGQGVVQ